MATKVKKRLDVFCIPTEKQIQARLKERYYEEEPFVGEDGKVEMLGGWNINAVTPHEEGMKWFKDFILNKKKAITLPDLFLHQYDTTKPEEMRSIDVMELDSFFEGIKDMRDMMFNKPKK